MRSGRVYEVFVNGEPVKLVGSTVQTLKQRRSSGYVKRFGIGVELRLVREIARPADYSDKDFEFYLRACEAMDIARKGTYVEHGGLNMLSPLVQSLGHPLISEIARLGGRNGGPISGRKNVESGHLANITTFESCSKGGRKAVESGHLASIATFESRSKGSRNQSLEDKARGGRNGSREGKARGGRIGSHIRWHVRRGITNPSCSLCTPKADTIQ